MTERPRKNHFGAKIAERMAQERQMLEGVQDFDELVPEEIAVAEAAATKTWRVLDEVESAKLRVSLRRW